MRAIGSIWLVSIFVYGSHIGLMVLMRKIPLIEPEVLIGIVCIMGAIVQSILGKRSRSEDRIARALIFRWFIFGLLTAATSLLYAVVFKFVYEDLMIWAK